jgi:hypothetical protein
MSVSTGSVPAVRGGFVCTAEAERVVSTALQAVSDSFVVSGKVLTVEQARMYANAVRSCTGGVVKGLVVALHGAIRSAGKLFQGQGWKALGYESWDALCAAEFSEVRLWDSPDARAQQAVLLTEDYGMSRQAVAVLLGVCKSTVQFDLKREIINCAENRTVDNSGSSAGQGGNGVSWGLDGRVRPARRSQPELAAKRKLQAYAMVKQQGLTQAQAGQALAGGDGRGVKQPFVSHMVSEVEDWLKDVSPSARQAVEAALTGDQPDLQGALSALDEVLVVAPSGQARQNRLLNTVKQQVTQLAEVQETLWSSREEERLFTSTKQQVADVAAVSLAEHVSSLVQWLGTLPVPQTRPSEDDWRMVKTRMAQFTAWWDHLGQGKASG